MMPSEAATGNEAATADAIQEQQVKLARFMQWWDRGLGKQAALTNPILSAVEPSWLADIIAAGQGYHTILTSDRLDALQRTLGNGTDPTLEPLRRTLRAGGNHKTQARALGMLLFKEARSLFDQSEAGDRGAEPPTRSPDAPAPAPTLTLDEVFTTPRLYVNSDQYPAGATIAVRAAPSKDAPMIKPFAQGAHFMGTGVVGDWLEFRFVDAEIRQGEIKAYVNMVFNGLVLLVPAAPPPQQALPEAPALPHAEVNSLASTAPVAQSLSTPVRPEAQRRLVQTATPQATQNSALAPARLEGLEVRVGRLEALEARVLQQDCQIQALQSELAGLKGYLSTIAASFAPLAASARQPVW